RLKLLSFTGSPAVGWDLKARCGKKKVVLELGGNAAVVVDHDADLDNALERIIYGAFYQSGQSCIGVQRIIVHEDIYDRFKDMLVAKTKTLVAGDPKDRDTFIGPMISEGEASRLKGWIDEAVAGGATLLTGGSCKGNMLEATLLEGVHKDAKALNEEAFGPLAILQKFSNFDEAQIGRASCRER
ncbi:MAG TPA: aldehyde dehydrogenase, partial [Erythrobacter sp.]|nr:aldehyde dehydrogenase [Erythrobacter sp.]